MGLKLFRFTTVCLFAAAALAGPIAGRAQQDLAREFASPPAAARPHTWWHWMNGNITRAGITADLEAMAHVGIGGAQIFNVDQGVPPGPVDYMSDTWRADVAFAASEAKRLGIELCFHNCAGWSSSGGPWITPAASMQMLTWSEATVTSDGSRVSIALPEPPKRAGYYEDIAVLAAPLPPDGDSYRIPDIRTKALFERGGAAIAAQAPEAPQGKCFAAEQIRILQCTPEGAISAQLPAGKWLILRMGHTSTGETNHPAQPSGLGLEVDKLSSAAMDLHWEHGVAPVLSALGPDLAGKVLNNALIDSYEVGTQNWTPKMREEFRKRCGYDPVPWLLTIAGRVVSSSERSERFLWDLRRTCCDLFAENYAGRFRELCHRNGLKFSVEPYGNGPFDTLQVGEMADIPMGEFWIGGAALETLKIAASAAHTTGRQVVGAESFTADDIQGRFLEDPYGLKALGDRAFAQGVNRYIFHRYAHQPWSGLDPGMTMGPWGTHLERTQTWWEQSREWLKYVARCQHLLQSGSFVADVLTFAGDDAPGDILRPNLPRGFDYDGCDRTVLATASVENGRIVLPSGARYRALIIPDGNRITPQTLRALVRLSRAGATIVGRKPERSPSLRGFPACDAEVQQLASELKLTDATALPTVLGAPDVELPTGTDLPWIHRHTSAGEIYFVSNPRYSSAVYTVGFRCKGLQPEIWHADTGRIENAAEWRTEGDRTHVTLRFDPAGSLFVVFRRAATRQGRSQVVRESRTADPIAKPRIVILEARYEATDGAGGADVTTRVRDMVSGGAEEIGATNANFGDPITLHVKRLRIRYTLNGAPMDKSVPENGTIDLTGGGQDIRLPEMVVMDDKLVALKQGTYLFADSSGRKRRINAPAPAEIAAAGPWTLSFPAGKGAPSQVTLDRLISWSDHPNEGVRYFSGSATYTSNLTVPPAMLGKGRTLILDLGQVKHFAEVTINGTALPTLWKAPWRLDVTGLLKPGANTLSVRVTNLWVNRLIGDEHLPAEVEYSGPIGPIRVWPQWLVEGKERPKTERVAFSAWRFWQAGDPLLPSGLIGPVRVLSARTYPLR